MEVELPFLYVGMDNHFKAILKLTGLERGMIRRVNTIHGLRGYKDKVLFYDWGFHWIIKDPDIMGYCRSHNIKVVPASYEIMRNLTYKLKDVEVT